MKLTYCPFCLSAVQSEICPYCGNSISYTGDPMHLQVGYVLNGMHPYVLGASLGQGGFGITYIALDIVENRRVAIKEYFPTYCAGRNGDVTVASYRGQEGNFLKGKERFLDEARMLKSLSDLSGVVDVLDFFEANNSAYLVMEFLEGNSLKEHVERSGKLSAQPFLKQLKPLMSDVEKMHHRGVIHRDIAPDNIIMLPDGRLKLIDFGAARSYLGDKSMTVVVKKGFAPVEQYMRKGGNASTDVYALAATIYYCITGVIPADSAERQYGEELQAPTKLGAELSREQEQALEKALAIQPMERTQSVAEMIKGLEYLPKSMLQKQEEERRQQEILRKKQEEERRRQEMLQKKQEEECRRQEMLQKKQEEKRLQQEELRKKQEEKRLQQEELRKKREEERRQRAEQKEKQAAHSEKSVKTNSEKSGKRYALMAATFAVVVLVVLSGVLFFVREGAEDIIIPGVTAEVGQPVSEEPELPEANTFRRSIYGNTMTLSGEGIKITVRNDRAVSITLSGLELMEEYLVNQASTQKSVQEYSWGVKISDGQTTHEIKTSHYAMEPGQEKMVTLSDMQHSLWLISENQGETIQPVEMSHTSDSITWKYILDVGSTFDFKKVNELEVSIGGVSAPLQWTRNYVVAAKGMPSADEGKEEPIADTVPTETEPVLSKIEPVPTEATNQIEPALKGDIFEEISFSTRVEGDTIIMSGEFLEISVQDGKEVSVTLTGLNMKDEYVVNLKSTEKNYWEYYWDVQLFDGEESHRVVTLHFAEEPGRENTIALKDMEHSLLRKTAEENNVTHWETAKSIQMSYTSDSIRWEYTLDEKTPFDFEKVEEVEVMVEDPSMDLLLSRVYEKTDNESFFRRDAVPPVAEEAIKTEESSADSSKDPGKHQIFEDELSFKSNSITPVRIRDNGYSLHSAKFLDKPVNNCVSISAEITVEEGTPEGFDVYIQDIDKWRAAGRIKANGEKVITGTVSFSKAVSFNAFAIVPAGGDYQTTISYKLTGAEVKGSLFQSSWTEKDVVFSGGDLQIQVNDNREVIVSLSGLDLLDEFPSKVSGRQGTEEYQWNVYLTSGNNFLSFQTDCPVPVNKFNQPKVTVWKDMKHSAALGALAFGEADDHIIKGRKPTVTHTADSITWTFELDQNHPFDFKTGITAEINWFDRANGKSEHSFYFGR